MYGWDGPSWIGLFVGTLSLISHLHWISYQPFPFVNPILSISHASPLAFPSFHLIDYIFFSSFCNDAHAVLLGSILRPLHCPRSFVVSFGGWNRRHCGCIMFGDRYHCFCSHSYPTQSSLLGLYFYIVWAKWSSYFLGFFILVLFWLFVFLRSPCYRLLNDSVHRDEYNIRWVNWWIIKIKCTHIPQHYHRYMQYSRPNIIKLFITAHWHPGRREIQIRPWHWSMLGLRVPLWIDVSRWNAGVRSSRRRCTRAYVKVWKQTPYAV